MIRLATIFSGGFSGGRKKVVNKVIQVGVEDIQPNPHQPRTQFAEAELLELAASIRQNGVLQPLTVRRLADGKFELISGERRLRAAKFASLEYVPCIVMDTTARNSAVLALIENIQRQDLSYFDEAYAIDRLIDFYGMTQEDAAIKLGKAQSTIANKLRLLRLTELEKKLLMEYGMTERHARALLRIPEEAYRLEVIEKVHKSALNVCQTEQLVEQTLTQMDIPPRAKRVMVISDVRMFVNTINRAVEHMQAAGIMAKSHKTQNEDYIEYTVKIPLKK